VSLLTIADARDAGLGKGLTDPQLQARINGVEAQLSGRIGPLTGERTTTWPAGRPVWLDRPHVTDPAPVVTHGATTLVVTTDYELRPGGQLYLVNGPSSEAVSMVWTPADEDAVRDAVLQLLDLSLRPYQSESIGDYSYARGGQKMLQRTRDEIMAALVYGRGTGS
jgi:hypothetical protein